MTAPLFFRTPHGFIGDGGRGARQETRWAFCSVLRAVSPKLQVRGGGTKQTKNKKKQAWEWRRRVHEGDHRELLLESATAFLAGFAEPVSGAAWKRRSVRKPHATGLSEKTKKKYVYIYIYRERERERETFITLKIKTYIKAMRARKL